jgi:hypothetical protein
VFLQNRVPPKVRNAYMKDAWTGILGSVMTGLTVPFIAIIAREQLKASIFEIGIITAVPAAGCILSLYWAHVMQGRSAMAFAVWPGIICRTLLLLTIFAVNSWSFVIIIALFWIISTIPSPAYSVLMKEIYPDTDRVRVMSYVRVCIVCTSIIVSAFAGPLLKVVSYRYVFPIAGLFGIASAISFSRIPSAAVVVGSTQSFLHMMGEAVDALRRDHAYRWFCGGVFIFGAANLFASPIYAVYQVDVLHVDTRWASVYAVVCQVMAMGAYFYWGAYIDRKKPAMISIVSTALCCAVPINYLFASHAWMLIPTCVINGIANAGLELSYFNSILHYAPSNKVTLYQGIFTSLMGIRGISIPFISAALVQNEFLCVQTVFIASALMIALGVLIQIYGVRKYET